MNGTDKPSVHCVSSEQAASPELPQTHLLLWVVIDPKLSTGSPHPQSPQNQLIGEGIALGLRKTGKNPLWLKLFNLKNMFVFHQFCHQHTLSAAAFGGAFAP